jgi:hypothetical protein
MEMLIDDFTTGPFSVKLTDEVASRSDTQTRRETCSAAAA